MLTDLIRRFCNESKDDAYEVYENYSGRGMFGRRTIGIVVKQGNSYLDMLTRLTRFLEEAEFDDPLSLEGVAVDELGLDVIVYFPAIRDYSPQS